MAESQDSRMPTQELQDLAALGPSRLPAQKIACVEDFFEPRTEHVIRRIFGLEPHGNSRLWEFARTFDLLASFGLLRPDARGVSFGSAREVLLYCVAKNCAHLTATDLYTGDTSWLEARAEDASAFVLAGAPFPVDPSHLTALSMDARVLHFPDASFDFAYSISSIEHFGDDSDMIRHLTEVRRVLKPGGRYVLTTEACFAPDTRRSVGNYAFAVPHLLQLVAAAGMVAEPLVDLHLSARRENIPVQYADAVDYGLAVRLEQSLIWRDLGGLVSGPICLVLRPGSGPLPDIRELAETTAWINARQIARLGERYSDWVRLNPFALLVNPADRWCALWHEAPYPPPPSLVFATQYDLYGDAVMEVRVTCAAMPGPDGYLAIAVNEMQVQDTGVIVVHHSEPVAFLPGSGTLTAAFRFTARKGHVYSIYGLRASETLPMLASVDVVVRRPA